MSSVRGTGAHLGRAMPASEPPANHPPDRQGQAQRRRPFSTWVKKLTNFKSSDGERPKRHKKKRGTKANNPYPESGHVNRDNANGESACSFTDGQTSSNTTMDQSTRSSVEGNTLNTPPTAGNASAAGTDPEGSHSIKAPSHGESSLTGTNRTIGGGMESRRGGDSTFSSPAPSVRSLTTTLTTIQSVAAPNGNTATPPAQGNTQSIQFSQPFPSTAPPTAIPAHLAPSGNPTTYNAATANNLLTDNASILTLASSSKRRRRRSMDTDASVRALAPSSLWGGSRESLPLSILSANIDAPNMPSTPGLHGGSSRIGAERNSIYSATGVAPAMPGERTSMYAKQGDGASIRSGFLGHSRAESVSGSNALTPLTSAREVPSEKSDRSDKGDKGDKDGGSVTTAKDE